MRKIQRTMVAQAANDLSVQFAIQFASLRVAGECDHLPVLLAPEAESTAGGRQARQHVVLRPMKPGYPELTVGWVNMPEEKASLRTFDCVVELYRVRYPDRTFPIRREAYDGFFNAARAFLATHRFHVGVETRPPQTLKPSSAPPPGRRHSEGRTALAVGLLLIIGAVGALAWWITINGGLWP